MMTFAHFKITLEPGIGIAMAERKPGDTMRMLLASMPLASCSIQPLQPQAFRGPNGKTAYSMNCGSTLDACYKKAGEVCPEGYNIIDRASGFVAVPINGGVMAAPRHNLAIECK